jgi:hypothetical protein
MSPGPVTTTGAPCGFAQCHALACLLGLHGASRQAKLGERPLLIRCTSEEALFALGLGAPHCPALQDIIMLFQTACILLPIAQPSFLVTPDGLRARPAPSNAANIASLGTSAPCARTHTLSPRAWGAPSPSTSSPPKVTRSRPVSTHNGPKPHPRLWTHWHTPTGGESGATHTVPSARVIVRNSSFVPPVRPGKRSPPQSPAGPCTRRPGRPVRPLRTLVASHPAPSFTQPPNPQTAPTPCVLRGTCSQPI